MGMIFSAPGCCTVLHGPNRQRVGRLRPVCFFLGNFVFALIPGMVVDVITGAYRGRKGIGRRAYRDASDLKEGDSRKLLAVYLKDGRIFILRPAKEGEVKLEEISQERRFSKDKILKHEWVMEASSS